MMRRYQKGEVVTVMLVMVVIMSIGWMWKGMGHGGDTAVHAPAAADTARTEKTALEILDEAYARGGITRDEYFRKREDLQKK